MVEPTNDDFDGTQSAAADDLERLAADRVRALRRTTIRKRAPSTGFGGSVVADGATVRELLPISGERTAPSDAREVEVESDLAGDLGRLRAEVEHLDLRVREQIEIEHVRDLEIARLEHELDQTNAERGRLADELFHATRRADDLDLRWNALAATYEECAAHLVEAGAQLESIHAQTSYRLVLLVARILRRRPTVYVTVRRLLGRRRRPDAR